VPHLEEPHATGADECVGTPDRSARTELRDRPLPNLGTEIEHAFPDGQVVGVTDSTGAALASAWSTFAMPYDWNPTVASLRKSGTTRFKRVGSFLAQSIRYGPTGEVHLLWGSGSRSDLELLTAELGGAVLRSDVATARHVEDLRPRPAFSVHPNRAIDDYIYDLGEQVSMTGKKFSRRRTYLRALQRSSPSSRIVSLDPTDAADAAVIRQVQDEWLRTHGDSTTAAREADALERCLTADILPTSVRGVGLEIGGTMCGFALYDVVDGRAAAHFVKAHRDSAITCATWQGMFEDAALAGASELNAGYDGGLPGLRAAKTNLRPACRIESVLLVSV